MVRIQFVAVLLVCQSLIQIDSAPALGPFPPDAQEPGAPVSPSGAQSSATAASSNGEAAPRSFHEIRAELRGALQREAQTTAAADWAATVVQLTDLYCEIMRDSRLSTSDTLRGYRVKLRARLLKIQKQLERELKRARKANRRLSRRSSDQPARQQGGAQLAVLLSLSGDSLGGPATLFKYGGANVLGSGGGAARFDYGSDLVELIRRTISPEFWDVNGGPGVIFYYRPWYALVIRATAEIHEQIGGPLGGLK